VIALRLAFVALGLAVPAAAAPPYPLLVERDGLRVYGPTDGQRWGRCPGGALPVRAVELRIAERAVLLAVPRLYARQGSRPRIEVRDARARALRIGADVSTRAGLARATCGRTIAGRSLAVHVGFPHVTWSASLSSATFFVARVRDGWVLWHQAH
jgi:hypothetical protein